MSSVYQILRDGSSGDTDTHPPYANGKRAALPRDPKGDSGEACAHLPSQTRTGFVFSGGFPVSKSKLWFLRPPAVTKHPSRKPRGGVYVPLPIPTKCRNPTSRGNGCLCIPVLAVMTWSGWLPYGSFPTQRSRSVFYRVTLAENKRFRDYVKYPPSAPGPGCRLTTNRRTSHSLKR